MRHGLGVRLIKLGGSGTNGVDRSSAEGVSSMSLLAVCGWTARCHCLRSYGGSLCML